MKNLTRHLFPLVFGIAYMSMSSLHARAADAVTEAATKKVIATVDGHKITEAMYVTYLTRRGIQDLKKVTPELHKQYVDELVNRELLYHLALKNKLDKQAEVAIELNNIKRNLLAAAQIRKAVLSQNKITEDMLKKEYQAQIKNIPAKEYHARHILTKSKEDAVVVIMDLNQGKDFAELAKTKSTGPTGENGGDLGWFRNGQMLPKFTEAVTKLGKGKYTKEPVKTQYGWHVILLEDTRESPPPSYEELKQQIKMSLSNKQLGSYIESLKTKSKIKVN